MDPVFPASEVVTMSIVTVLTIALWGAAIVDTALRLQRSRSVESVFWLIGVILIPVLGAILWFAVGRWTTRTTAVDQFN